MVMRVLVGVLLKLIVRLLQGLITILTFTSCKTGWVMKTSLLMDRYKDFSDFDMDALHSGGSLPAKAAFPSLGDAVISEDNRPSRPFVSVRKDVGAGRVSAVGTWKSIVAPLNQGIGYNAPPSGDSGSNRARHGGASDVNTVIPDAPCAAVTFRRSGSGMQPDVHAALLGWEVVLKSASPTVDSMLQAKGKAMKSIKGDAVSHIGLHGSGAAARPSREVVAFGKDKGKSSILPGRFGGHVTLPTHPVEGANNQAQKKLGEALFKDHDIWQIIRCSRWQTWQKSLDMLYTPLKMRMLD